MNTTISLQSRLRIIWAIALKDIIDAIKNQVTVSVLLGTLMVMLTAQVGPLLMSRNPTTAVVVYSAESSKLVSGLRESAGLRVFKAPTLQDLEEEVGDSPGAMLGLEIPAAFDETLAASGQGQLDGYFAHWVTDEEKADTLQLVGERIAELTGQSVPIRAEGHVVYPTAGSLGPGFMFVSSMLIIIITICGILVPFLIIDEKEARTLDVLLVSPSSITQVVLGKAIAGLFYGVLAVTLVFLFNQGFIVHWGWVVAATVAGLVLSVAVGLLLGVLFDNVQNLGLWMGLVFLILLGPPFMEQVAGARLSAAVRDVVAWFPTVALQRVLGASLARSVPVGNSLIDLAVVLACGLAILALAGWRLRQHDRI